MKTIWKFILKPEIEIEMPKGTEILTVAAQRDEICLWAKVDPNMQREKRKFMTFGTGHDIPDIEMKYIGTSQLSGGALIFHTFEVIGNGVSNP